MWSQFKVDLICCNNLLLMTHNLAIDCVCPLMLLLQIYSDTLESPVYNRYRLQYSQYMYISLVQITLLKSIVNIPGNNDGCADLLFFQTGPEILLSALQCPLLQIFGSLGK